jgi:hypothetical protein
MINRNKTIFIQIVVLIGIILDALEAIEFYLYAVMGNKVPINRLNLILTGCPEFQYTASMVGAFMLAWTILLIWSFKDPINRRGVLFCTMGVVLLLLVTSDVLAYEIQLFQFQDFLASIIPRLGISILFGLAFIFATQIAKDSDKSK